MNLLNATLISLAAAAAFASAASAKEGATPDTAPAMASASPDAATAAAGAAIVNPDDKIVCKSRRYTGTRMAVRVCETVGERKRRLAEERVRQVKDDTRGGGMSRVRDMDPGQR